MNTTPTAAPRSSRQEVDAVVSTGDLALIIDKIIEETARIAVGAETAELRGEVHGMAQELLDMTDKELAFATASGMLRYLVEDGSYVGDTAPLDCLKQRGLILPGTPLLDLGAGSGNVVHQWAKEGNPAMGVDLSPSFVLEHNRTREGVLLFGRIDGNCHLIQRKLLELCTLAGRQNTMVHSSLTLDRVGDPGQLVQNMSDLAGDFGNSALFTLLPVVPEDDDRGVKQKIIYTPEEHRITSTGSVEGDRRNIQEYMEDAHRRLVTVIQSTYRVRTATDVHEYTNYFGFITEPKK